MPRATYKNRSGGFDANENQAMSDFLFDEFTWFADRPTSEKDFQGWVQMHARANCALVRHGKVLVSVPGHNPLERLTQ